MEKLIGPQKIQNYIEFDKNNNLNAAQNNNN